MCVWQAEHGCKSLVMIGDGATDLEARQEGGADLFIGCAYCQSCCVYARHFGLQADLKCCRMLEALCAAGMAASQNVQRLLQLQIGMCMRSRRLLTHFEDEMDTGGDLRWDGHVDSSRQDQPSIKLLVARFCLP